MASQNLYQGIRTQVKKNLNRVVERANMEPAIRASTPAPIEEAEAALREFLGEHGFHVIHETDVEAIHNHYKLGYPGFKILKVVRARNFMSCPMASSLWACPGLTTSMICPPATSPTTFWPRTSSAPRSASLTSEGGFGEETCMLYSASTSEST